jgi:hypothetical protein
LAELRHVLIRDFTQTVIEGAEMWLLFKRASSWSAFFAFVAIILSQSPHIVDWIPSEKIEISAAKSISLDSHLGILSYHIPIAIVNKGNRTVEISKLELEITDFKGKVTTYAGEGFLNQTGFRYAELFSLSTIRIKPNDTWGYRIYFEAPMTAEQEKTLSKLRVRMSKELFEKRQKDKVPEGFIVEAENTTVEDAKAIFDANSKDQLGVGAYKAKILARDGGGKVIAEYCFSFHIYEYHKDLFDSQKDDFKYGWGITDSPDYNKYISLKTE